MSDLRVAINPIWDSVLNQTSLEAARTALGVTEGGANMTAFGALTNVTNGLPYMTGSDAWAVTTLTSFGRSLIDDGDATAALATLGITGTMLTVTASSLANPGYMTLSNGITIQWGTQSCSGNASATITYSIAFSSFAVCMGSGGPSNVSKEGDVRVTANGLTTSTIVNTSDTASTFFWVAIGV